MLLTGLFVLLFTSAEGQLSIKDNVVTCSYGKLCPFTCSDTPKRVCGSDRRLYERECELNCEGYCEKKTLFKIPMRICEEVCDMTPCNCGNEVKKVCGSDGIMYQNRCKMECAARCRAITERQLKFCYGALPAVLHPNVIGPKRCNETDCNCDNDHSGEVCGSDGITYKNICLLKCANRCRTVSLQHMKFCQKSESSGNSSSCDLIYCMNKCPVNNLNPRERVCGTDGEYYQNICTLRCVAKCRTLKAQAMRFCRSSFHSALDAPQFCDAEQCGRICRGWKKNPVCGSDGKVHENYCWLRCEARCKPIKAQDMKYCPPRLTKEDLELCDEKSCDCPKGGVKLCGSDKKIYDNYCSILCVMRCKRRNVTIKTMDFCLEEEKEYVPCFETDCDCPSEFKPLCGSDGRIFANPCIFKCASRCKPLEEKPMEFCDDKRECVRKECVCAEQPDEPSVCDTNDNFYRNRCQFECLRMCEPIIEAPNVDCNSYKHSVHKLGLCGKDKALCKRNVNCTKGKGNTPVCGSDGKVYSSICSLMCYNTCTLEYDITEKPMEFCDKNERSRSRRNRYW